MKVSVLIPYFQGRRALLARTLWLLRRQTYEDLEIWLLDDGSDERVEELCGGKVIYEMVRPPLSPPRASNMAWCHGYRLAQGDFIILTHPEYMPPLDAVKRIVDGYDGCARLAATSYAIPPRMLAVVDKLDWRRDVDVLQHWPGFWSVRTPWGWTNMEAKGWHHHLAFSGQDRAGWDLFKFLPETEQFQMNDSWLSVVEVESGRPPQPAGFAVYHQDHRRRSEWPFAEKSTRVRRIEANR